MKSYTKKLFITVLCFGFSLSISAADNFRDSVLAVLNNKQLTPVECFDKVTALFNTHLPDARQSEKIYLKDVIPFVEKNMPDNSEVQAFKALAFINIAGRFSADEAEDAAEKKKLYLEKAIETIELTDNVRVKAAVCFKYAQGQLRNGSLAVAHDYFYKAAAFYDKQENYKMEMSCLYHIAIAHLNIRDDKALLRIINDMQKLVDNHPEPELQYKLNAVSEAYWYVLASENDYKTASYNDSALLYGKKNMALIECCRAELDPHLSVVWEYFNMATHYYNFFTDKNDSITFYLNKALAEKKNISEPALRTQVDISVYGQFAEMHIRERNYGQAEKDLLYVLQLLKKVEDNNNVVVDFAETYTFLVDLYEKTNRPAEALKYQKLLQKSEQRRFDKDKIDAINEMAAKYETEKKEIQIQTLQKQRKMAHTVIALVAALALLLLAGLLLLVRFFRIRKEKMEQEIYEKALLVEMKHSELENIKQGLQEKPMQVILKKLLKRIDESILDKPQKENYAQSLLKLDAEMLDKAFVAEKDQLTNMDRFYILCFAADIKTADIGTIFNVDVPSVRTVRYRIKKKVSKEGSVFSMI